MSWPWIVAFVVLWIVVLVLVLVVLGLMRMVAPLLAEAEERLSGRSDAPPTDNDGLSPGERVPPFELSNGEGEKVRIGDESLPLPAVFLFVDNGGCGSCRRLTVELEEQAPLLEDTPLYVIPKSPVAQNGYDALRARGLAVLEQSQGQASEAFRQRQFPQAFAVNRDRRVVGKTVPGSVADLKRLAHQTGFQARRDEGDQRLPVDASREKR